MTKHRERIQELRRKIAGLEQKRATFVAARTVPAIDQGLLTPEEYNAAVLTILWEIGYLPPLPDTEAEQAAYWAQFEQAHPTAPNGEAWHAFHSHWGEPLVEPGTFQ